MKTVFLGGTCNESTWRDELMPQIPRINFFNPVVEDWTPEAQAEELRQREICDYCLYVLTPKMTGVYSVAEVVDDSNKRPHKTLFLYLEKDGEQFFEPHQIKSLTQLGKLVEANGARWFGSLAILASFLNHTN